MDSSMNGQRASNRARLLGEVWPGGKEDDVRSDEEIGDRLHVSGGARTNAEPRSANAGAQSHVPERTATKKRQTYRDQDVDLHEQASHVTVRPSGVSEPIAKNGERGADAPGDSYASHTGTHGYARTKEGGASQIRRSRAQRRTRRTRESGHGRHGSMEARSTGTHNPSSETRDGTASHGRHGTNGQTIRKGTHQTGLTVSAAGVAKFEMR